MSGKRVKKSFEFNVYTDVCLKEIVDTDVFRSQNEAVEYAILFLRERLKLEEAMLLQLSKTGVSTILTEAMQRRKLLEGKNDG